jgi:hypothetical protein
MNYIKSIQNIFHTVILKTTIPGIMIEYIIFLLYASPNLLTSFFRKEACIYPLFYPIFALFYLGYYTYNCPRHPHRSLIVRRHCFPRRVNTFTYIETLFRAGQLPFQQPCKYPKECSLFFKAALLFFIPFITICIYVSLSTG